MTQDNITIPRELLRQAIDAMMGVVNGEPIFGVPIVKSVNALRAALEQPAPVQEPRCNPHPKAPHGFDRNASHSAHRYVCDCESWEPYDAGYNDGFQAGIEFDTYTGITGRQTVVTNGSQRIEVIQRFAELVRNATLDEAAKACESEWITSPEKAYGSELAEYLRNLKS